jgi:hypothetical protein
MSFSDSQKKILGDNGYTQSSTDSNKYINGGHSVTSRGGSTIINTDRHNTYGSGMSDSFLKDRTKK